MGRRVVQGPDPDNLKAGQVREYLQLGEKEFRRLRRDGRFPEPINPGAGVPVWDWLSVVAWAHLYGRTRALRLSRREKSGEKSAPAKPGRDG